MEVIVDLKKLFNATLEIICEKDVSLNLSTVNFYTPPRFSEKAIVMKFENFCTPDGLQTNFYPSGFIWQTINFKNNEKHGEEKVFADMTMNLLSHGFYKNGKKHGKWFVTKESGADLSKFGENISKVKGCYNEGIEHGVWELHHEDGLIEKGVLKGSKHGCIERIGTWCFSCSGLSTKFVYTEDTFPLFKNHGYADSLSHFTTFILILALIFLAIIVEYFVGHISKQLSDFINK